MLRHRRIESPGPTTGFCACVWRTTNMRLPSTNGDHAIKPGRLVRDQTWVADVGPMAETSPFTPSFPPRFDQSAEADETEARNPATRKSDATGEGESIAGLCRNHRRRQDGTAGFVRVSTRLRAVGLAVGLAVFGNAMCGRACVRGHRRDLVER